ncbi:MAG: hypothetical protein NC253_04690 [Ruminococcus sp.]|nr:hypothetical protein [Ruminococcus sp.]MCM1382222.1 hypothetical protein [Muribaculaceae bacterium]MCM1478780.1 hypothetical protein [Muribaculaceae bacterium]
MPTQKFTPSEEDRKKIKQLEKEIKLMKKDMNKTFAEPKQKKLMTPIYISIGLLAVLALFLGGIYLYLNFVIN